MAVPFVFNQPWRANRLLPTDAAGRDTAWSNFSCEGWKDSQIFVREFLQNSLDAILDLSLPVRVIFRFRGSSDIDSAFHNNCLASMEPHLAALRLGASLRPTANPTALVVEEYNTTGLTGAYNNSRAEGDFSGFFHGQAKETKGGGKNGRAGVNGGVKLVQRAA